MSHHFPISVTQPGLPKDALLRAPGALRVPWPLPLPSGDEKRGARAVSRPDGFRGRQGFFWGK